jgi:predicted GIY-YIG superfamily endonuclease
MIRVEEKTTWYSYFVIHPITKVPVYAGITADIATRRSAHTGPSSRIREWLSGLGEVDLIPEVQIVGTFSTKDEALDHELKLINDIPGLLNERASRMAGRPRLGEEEKTFEATKPWVEAGMSRSTWFRRRAANNI